MGSARTSSIATDGHPATGPQAPGDESSHRSRATVSFVLLPSLSTVTPAGPTPSVTAATMPGVAGPGGTSAARVVVLDSAVRGLAADTGGTVLTASASGMLGTMFMQILNNFRTTYVLYYSPRGVDPGGFHTISVTVNRPGASVQARRGYFGG